MGSGLGFMRRMDWMGFRLRGFEGFRLIDDDGDGCDGYFFGSIICLDAIGSDTGMIDENLSDSPI